MSADNADRRIATIRMKDSPAMTLMVATLTQRADEFGIEPWLLTKGAEEIGAPVAVISLAALLRRERPDSRSKVSATLPQK